MTNHWIDLANSDCILIMGSNAAENHPISFRWVLRAQKKNRAKIIHVDPRFTRTSARADFHAALRSGTDIAFLGGMINYILAHDKFFRDYVANYTNGAFLVDQGFGFEDGLFTGYDPKARKYDKATWAFQKDAKGVIRKDPTLQDPRCVLRLMQKHYARYNLDKVAGITGTPVEDLKTVYEAFAATGRSDKAGTIMYALGWTQHTVGTQNIRTMAIIQLLLGNIGVCGGGVNALRGEPNVQGSTDHCILYHILPGYLKAPTTAMPDLAAYLKTCTPVSQEPQSANWWGNYPKYMVSLLKSWYGEAASKDNDFCYGHVPKLDVGQNTSIMNTFDLMYEGKMKGYICLAQNPACSMPHAGKVRTALGKLDWLVHANIFDNETPSFWHAPGMDPAKIKTEVFLLPAAASIEKSGSLTNSGRWVQWKYVAAQPPGDAIAVGDMVYRIVAKLKELYAKEGGAAPEPIRDLYWDYGDGKGGFDPLRTAKAINGYFLEDVTIKGKAYKKGQTVPSFGLLSDEGKTSSGNWLYSGMFDQQGRNLSARRGKQDPTGLGLFSQWAWCWPVNRRVLYNRASVDPQGKPYNPARPVIAWKNGKWVGDVPDGPWPPMADAQGKLPYIMKPHGVSSIFGPGLAEGPFPEHYEPVESPLAVNPMSSQRINPAVKLFTGAADRYASAGGDFPIVCTTYTATEHWCTGAITRWMSWLTEAMPQAYVEMSPELAEARGIANGDKVKVWSERGAVEAVALVTVRLRPFTVEGREVHQVGMTFNYGWRYPADAGDSANLLTPTVGDANTMAPEYKAFLVQVAKL
ncbi:MAG: formate dehydrogenase-N subunit alpha [Desulfarculaceae bacterium]|nr:formate dehydrogenase-N subunit alpha [Desulfarculaceae bacterium]